MGSYPIPIPNWENNLEELRAQNSIPNPNNEKEPKTCQPKLCQTPNAEEFYLYRYT